MRVSCLVLESRSMCDAKLFSDFNVTLANCKETKVRGRFEIIFWKNYFYDNWTLVRAREHNYEKQQDPPAGEIRE